MGKWKKLYTEIRESQLNEISDKVKRSYLRKLGSVERQSRAAPMMYWGPAGHHPKDSARIKARHEKHMGTARKLFKKGKFNNLGNLHKEETIPIYEGHDDVRIEMGHAVTRYDRKQEEKSIKNPKHYYNHYALGHYLGAADRAHEDLKKGHSLADAINNNFNGALARHLHKHFKTGDTDVDSKRRKYFNS
jgi:hypothetical protein